MAEKPRLKESNEILNSLGKKRGKRQPPQPDILPGDILPPPIVNMQQQDAAAQQEQPQDQQPAAEQQSAPDNDRRPLDFGKYELPKPKKRRGRPRKSQPGQPAASEAEHEPVVAEPAPAPAPVQAPPQQPEPVAAEPRGVASMDFDDLAREAERRRTEEAAERARLAADQAREQERLRTEEAAEKARLAAGEARKRAEEAAERARQQEEAAAELARRQQEAEEELARQRAEEETLRQRRAEEERMQKMREAEEARRRAEEAAELARREEEAAAELARRQQEAEEELARQRAEEEALRQRRAEAERLEKIREAEEARRRAEEAAEVARREEDAAMELARRQREIEEELARKRAEEEEARRRAEEARLRKIREEEEQQRLAEEERQRKIREEEEARRRAEEERQRKIQALEEARRKKEEEEAERLRLEEEARRKLLEDDGYREDVLGKLGSAFEQQFSQKFEGRKKRPKATPWWLAERREGLGKAGPSQEDPEPAPAPEPVAEEPFVPFAPQLPSEEEFAPLTPETLEKKTVISSFPEGQEPAPFIAESFDDLPDEAPAASTSPEMMEIPEITTLPEMAEIPEIATLPEMGEMPEITTLPEMAEFPQASGEDEERSQLEPDEFLEMFQEEVRHEEEDRQTSFRETLAQKFMREREHYLQDLGIADQMEAERLELEPEAEEQQPHITPPQHRKLDFQIQPEMHMPAGTKPGDVPPVTYSRNAQVTPQEHVVEEADPVDFPLASTPVGPDGKKTAEQLLLELGTQHKRKIGQPVQSDKPAQFHFQFANVPEPGEEVEEAAGKVKKARSPRDRMMMRIIAASATVALLILVLLGWGIARALNPGRDISPEDGIASLENRDDVLTIYDNYNADSLKTVGDVVVKRTGISLSNLAIQNRLIVEEEASLEGALTLSNLSVGDYIYINNSGVRQLDLNDVQAQRIVINNESLTVTVRATGSTDIGAVEIRTPAVVEQGELTGGAPGVRTLLAKSATEGATLGLEVRGATIQTFTSEGETDLNFTGVSVQNMTADSSFSLNGTGRVETLSAGYTTGAGAGDFAEAAPYSVQIKGVEVGHLNIKSPASINLYTPVDSIAAEDSVVLGGNGTVGSLVFNERFGSGRIGVEILGLNIQQLITNAEATIYSNGSSMINTLVANQSTYALGNKVNVLIANADGVIYENEPDSKRIAQGVELPQSRADNPQLDYSLQPLTAAPAAGAEDDSFVTTSCDHAKEVGGFLSGDGSAGNPFLVESPAQLAHVAQHPSSHFLQVSDIDISTDSSYSAGFPMIGTGGDRFSGSYDGGGYSIRNLRINSSAENVGLFSENTGTIRSLNVVSGEISANSASFVGAIVGMNYQGGTVEACSNGATVYAEESTYAGGIVGYNYGGRVRDCYNTARVGGGSAAGGLVGMNRQSASVTGSYSIGVVEGSTAGAIAGVNEAVVTNCYYLETDDDQDGIGDGEGTVVAKNAAQLAGVQMPADLAAGNENSLWQGGNDSYAYPTLRKSTSRSTAAVTYDTPASTTDPSGDSDASGGDYNVFDGADPSEEYETYEDEE